jgi:glycosyltransferase involved in cell wall biosynthesis
MPRIGFLLGHPSQFDAPFFRHAQSTGLATLAVSYLEADGSTTVNDAELGRRVDWGIDLLSGYPHKSVPPSGWLRWLSAELRAESYDWLIVDGYRSVRQLAALAIANLHGIRTALRIDSVLFNAGGWYRKAMKGTVTTALAHAFDRFLVTGSLAREYLLHFGVAPERIALFPYCIDAEWFAREATALGARRAAMRETFGVPGHASVVLAVAKMNAREAPWDLLDALRGLSRPDLWTVLVGDGEQRNALEKKVRALRLERLVFAGYVPYRQLPRCYAMADLLVHAAANEPWGVSVHEAIASGLPVVASSRVGAARDLVLEGRNGYVYDWGDAAQLRARLIAALDGFDRRAVQCANREVLARWNYARVWNGLLETCA